MAIQENKTIFPGIYSQDGFWSPQRKDMAAIQKPQVAETKQKAPAEKQSPVPPTTSER